MDQERYSEFKVSKELSSYIDCIWFGQENKSANHYIIPDNTVELLFTTSAIERQKEGDSGRVELKSHLAGLKTKAQSIQIQVGKIAGVRFKPEGIHSFIKHDASEIVNESIQPELIFGNKIKALEEYVLESLTSNQDEDLLASKIESYFLEEVKHATEDQLFRESLRQIQLTNGNISIACLADQFGCSIKTIERKFKQKMGLTPKKISQLYRFHQSILAMELPTDKFSDIAYDFGYFDQMHFIKDVKRYTGLTPKNIFAFKSGLQKPTLTRK